MQLFNVNQKSISELTSSELQPGAYEITWDGTNYSSGVYFYRIETNGFVDKQGYIVIELNQN